MFRLGDAVAEVEMVGRPPMPDDAEATPDDVGENVEEVVEEEEGEEAVE